MNPRIKQKFLDHASKLVVEGEKVISERPKINSAPGLISFAYVDGQRLSKWTTSCRNLVKQLGKCAAAWENCFSPPQNENLSNAEKELGNLKSLHDAINEDALSDLENLITANNFGELIEQAQELHDKGYSLAGGVLARAVLEEHLRNLCQRDNCMPQVQRPTISDFNMALYAAKTIDKLAMQTVTALATAGNHCAHNKQPPMKDSEVEKLINDVRTFLVHCPL